MLDGLALSSPLDKFEPSFHLHGLGLDYNKPPLEIGGMFARFDDRGQEEYAGLVVVKTEALSLSALGAYTKDAEGHPSMFIYMTLDKPLGGPPFFFVTGLAGGIGFNRALKVPPVEEIGKFPFVVQAMSASPAAIPVGGGASAMASSLDEQLNAVKEFVPPEAGQFWLAAGVKFTSFEIVDGFVLLTVSFGHRFEMRLLGEGTYAYPPPGSNETGTSLTKIKVDIEASYLPDEGLIEMSALIADGSYLYHPDCHLTGGIAFRSWFAGEYKDEFVLTIGGYHPKFSVPSHYPRVPRLGFNWQYSDALSVKGGAYFAMTGHVLMAGGFLDANWDSGCLRAWFKASADFLVRYKPFHYDIDISVEIGASVTIHFFGTHHLTLSLGASLHLEGPDFSGSAHLHIWIASFTIHFGAGPEAPKPLPWDEFRKSFLPKSEDDIIGISVQAGLIKTLKGRKLKQNSWGFEDADGATHWVMNAPEFALALHSMIPINKWILPESQDVITGTPFGIAPMNLRIENEDITSKITLTVKHHGEGDVTKDFVIEPVRQSVPAGLWGNEFLPDVNSESVVKDIVTGFQIKGGPHVPPDETKSIDSKNLAFDTDLLRGAYRWESGWDEFIPEDLVPAKSIATDNGLEVRNSLLASFDLPADLHLQSWAGVADESELLHMPISI
jgi:hypothetical protein